MIDVVDIVSKQGASAEQQILVDDLACGKESSCDVFDDLASLNFADLKSFHLAIEIFLHAEDLVHRIVSSAGKEILHLSALLKAQGFEYSLKQIADFFSIFGLHNVLKLL